LDLEKKENINSTLKNRIWIWRTFSVSSRY
jgi:hypothetical protein